MAVTKVTAELAGNSKILLEEKTVYSGEFTAPKQSGAYPVTITAYDDAGNVSVSSDATANVRLWHTPKTNWKSTDRFNIEDFNRIKNNLIYLHEFAAILYKEFAIEDMGPDMESYTQYWEVLRFNQFETNLDLINKNIFTRDFGTSQRFFENGPFIQWNELNRIETAILQINNTLESQKAGLTRLSFRFGQFKEVKI